MVDEKDIAFQKKMDSHVLELLEQCGSDMSEPHSLEHFLYAPNAHIAETMAAEAEGGGYNSRISESNYGGKTQWLLLLSRPVPPTEDSVNTESIYMMSLAHKHGADYDGWETMFIGDEASLDKLEDL